MTVQDTAAKFAEWLRKEGIEKVFVEVDEEDPTNMVVTYFFDDEELWVVFYETEVGHYNEADGLLEMISATTDFDQLIAAMEMTEL